MFVGIARGHVTAGRALLCEAERRPIIAKGDTVKVTYDNGDGTSREYEIVADKAGREVAFTRKPKENLLTVEVTGRAGTTARTLEFRADRVLIVEEVPA